MKLIPTLALLTLAATGATALAQPAPGPNGPPPAMGRPELDSLLDARVAAVQAGLRLTPEQQKLWPPVEQAIRAIGADRTNRLEERRGADARAPDDADFMGRLDRRAERLAARSQRITELVGTLKPLWATLDERQKRILPILMHPNRRFAGLHGWGRHPGPMGRMGGPDRDHAGPGRPGRDGDRAPGVR